MTLEEQAKFESTYWEYVKSIPPYELNQELAKETIKFQIKERILIRKIEIYENENH
jgi:P pilus assembly chaperone PapD